MLQYEMISVAGWSTKNQAVVGYSFWFVFIAAGIFFANSVVFLFMQVQRNKQRNTKNQVQEAIKPNGNLMLY